MPATKLVPVVAFAVVSLATLAVACGGRTLDDATGPNDSTSGGSGSGSGSGAGGGTGSGSGTATGGNGGTTGSGTSTPPSSGTSPGANPTGTTTAVPPPTPTGTGTVPAPPPGATIDCGSTTCKAGTEECCINVGGGIPGGPGGAGGTCGAIGSCNGTVVLTCSDAASCASGLVCCADLGLSGGEAVCAKACGKNPGTVQLCSTDVECPTHHCRGGQFGFGICRGF